MISQAISRVRGTAGYTLVEMLVAMLISSVVLAAIYSIMTVSLHQTSLITDKDQAAEVGRSTMNNIEEELHSSCTGFGVSAIQAPEAESKLGAAKSPLEGSNATNLWFISAYGSSEAAKADINKVTLNDIRWIATETTSTSPKYQLGKLVDYSFASSGEAGSWTFPTLEEANAKARTLGTNIAHIEVEYSGKKEQIPIFQYYGYNTKTSELSKPTYAEIQGTALSTPLSAKEKNTAKEAIANYSGNVTKVQISFGQIPNDKNTALSRVANLSDSVVLRLSPAVSESTSYNSPC